MMLCGWPSVLVLIQIKMQMWGPDYGDAPPPSADLLALISQSADGATETLSAADVAADASNYLTIPSPPHQKIYQISGRHLNSFEPNP